MRRLQVGSNPDSDGGVRTLTLISPTDPNRNRNRNPNPNNPNNPNPNPNPKQVGSNPDSDGVLCVALHAPLGIALCGTNDGALC